MVNLRIYDHYVCYQSQSNSNLISIIYGCFAITNRELLGLDLSGQPRKPYAGLLPTVDSPSNFAEELIINQSMPRID